MHTQQEIEPYVISIQFDNNVERLDEDRWVIGADVQIGDRLLLNQRKRRLSFVKKSIDGNINGDFMFVVCSPSFKKHPSSEYAQGIERAYIQQSFDKDDALRYITSSINKIGRVSVDVFTKDIHNFLLTDEWDWLVERIARRKIN